MGNWPSRGSSRTSRVCIWGGFCPLLGGGGGGGYVSFLQSSDEFAA